MNDAWGNAFATASGVVGGAGEGVQRAEVLGDVQVLQRQRRGGFRVGGLPRLLLEPGRLLVVAVLEVGVTLERFHGAAVGLAVRGGG